MIIQILWNLSKVGSRKYHAENIKLCAQNLLLTILINAIKFWN